MYESRQQENMQEVLILHSILNKDLLLPAIKGTNSSAMLNCLCICL